MTEGAREWQSKKTEDTVPKLTLPTAKAGGVSKGIWRAKIFFQKKYAKPLDNYAGIVYNKAMIKQGAEAPKGDKDGKHGKRKRQRSKHGRSRYADG